MTAPFFLMAFSSFCLFIDLNIHLCVNIIKFFELLGHLTMQAVKSQNTENGWWNYYTREAIRTHCKKANDFREAGNPTPMKIINPYACVMWQ